MNNIVAKPISRPGCPESIAFGVDDLDAALGGGLAKASVHEFFASTEADAVAATAVGLGLAHRASRESPLIWIRPQFAASEAGQPYGPGLAMFGLDPARIVLMAAKDAGMALKAALDVARAGSSHALLLELWGEHRMITLTASRRLFLAAKEKGLTIFMLRTGATPAPSAADTRWQVKSLASRALAANAPGHPRFELTLLRHRGMASGAQHKWCVEWRREQTSFAAAVSIPALSQPVVSIPANRPAAAERDFRRTG